MRNYFKSSLLSFKNSSKPFMTKKNELDDQLLMHKLLNGGQTSLWVVQENHQWLLWRTGNRRTYVPLQNQIHIPQRLSWKIIVYYSYHVIQVFNWQGCCTHSRTPITTHHTLLHRLKYKKKSVGEIHQRKRVGVLIKKMITSIEVIPIDLE